MAGNGTRAMMDTPVQYAAAAIGLGFVVVGAAGFIPGLTTEYDVLKLAGPDSEAMLLGVFQVSVLHNLVHLLLGAAGLVFSQSVTAARGFLVGGGLIYLALWIYGLVIDRDSSANFVPLNMADQWLHLALAAVMLLLGTALAGALRPEPAQP